MPQLATTVALEMSDKSVPNRKKNLLCEYQLALLRKPHTTMNLGEIYLQALLAIGAIVAAIVAAAALILYIIVGKQKMPHLASLAITGGLVASFLANGLFHQRLFTYWHESQNKFVPTSGCITYTPTFTRLYATYKMTPQEFNTWVMSHPWKLKSVPDAIVLSDERLHFGEISPEQTYETDMSQSGRQLRVFYMNGIAYLSYFAL